MTEILDVAQKLSGATLGVLAVFILWGGYRRIWVWGYQLDKAQTDGDEWKTMALRAAGLAETSVHIAKDTRRT